MPAQQSKYWPAHAGRNLSPPQTNLFRNAEVSALRYPDKPFLIFYDTKITFASFVDEAERVAGFLHQQCGVRRGDRVLLYMQNSPQFAIAYYGILRANAVVVPVNPMNLTEELRHYIDDADATTAIVAQELYPRIAPLLRTDTKLQHVVVATYSDYLKEPTPLAVPDFIAAPRLPVDQAGATSWTDLLAADLRPGALTMGCDDLCVMPYTSGTTGRPKGCMHTHRSAMHTAVTNSRWAGAGPELTTLAVAPWFHVTGMQCSMNSQCYDGGTVVILPRWDRAVAAELVQRYKVALWTAIPTMIVDFLSNTDLARFDLSSLRRLSGGGAAMPAAIAQRLAEMGLPYMEGYGLSETIATTHANPPAHGKKQCLGVPIFDTDSRIVDPVTLKELPPGEIGEIVTHGPQVFLGYWKNPKATEEAFIEIEGRKFLRTGDLAITDDEGYFFMVDRLKRMINASGYKVWPAEVESLMYQNEMIKEACVIAAKDAVRGETVKAVVVLKPEWQGKATVQDIIEWSKANMAAYKFPRIVEFVEVLPKSGSGKIMWRELQEIENGKAAPIPRLARS